MKKKFTITTLGCKVNQYESEVIAGSMAHDGCRCLPSRQAENDKPDVCIINTCTVTHKASMQSRQAIRKAIRKHPDARIIVTGCYAQTEPDVIRKIEGVHQVVAHRQKHLIPSMVFSPGAIIDTVPENVVNPDVDNTFSQSAPLLKNAGRTRPFLKIQDGCDAFCTYCIVPHARGSSRSMPEKSVREHISSIKNAGYHEVVLTGIHLGRYGLDFKPPATLYKLLKQIQSERLIDRLRLSSIEPLELSEDIIQLAARSENRQTQICRHFHIPLQSGDDAVLKKMNRPYSRKAFEKLVEGINRSIPDAGIGADILVGFPGETDDAFEQTYSLAKTLPLTYLHVFPFSAREGTPASKFPDKVKQPVIKERCRRLRDLGMLKKKAFYNSLRGRSYRVLIENRRDRMSGLLKGITSNYVPVLIAGDDDLMNMFQEVNLIKVQDDGLVLGELAEKQKKT